MLVLTENALRVGVSLQQSSSHSKYEIVVCVSLIPVFPCFRVRWNVRNMHVA